RDSRSRQRSDLRTSPRKRRTASPEADASLRRQVVAGLRLDVRECGVPAVVVSDDPVDAEFGWAVRIGENSLSLGAIPRLRPPTLAEREVEPLVPGEAVEHRRFLAAQGDLV